MDARGLATGQLLDAIRECLSEEAHVGLHLGWSDGVKRDPVTSTVLVSIGYDEDALVLELEFDGGAIYRYFEVPPLVHAELLGAESLGGYFARQVRDQYPYEQVWNSD